MIFYCWKNSLLFLETLLPSLPSQIPINGFGLFQHRDFKVSFQLKPIFTSLDDTLVTVWFYNSILRNMVI